LRTVLGALAKQGCVIDPHSGSQEIDHNAHGSVLDPRAARKGPSAIETRGQRVYRCGDSHTKAGRRSHFRSAEVAPLCRNRQDGRQ